MNRLIFTSLVFGIVIPSTTTDPIKEFIYDTLQFVPDKMDEYEKLCPHPLTPHVVLNQWGNAILIGCFIRKRISGYCLEYNEGIKTIQEHYGKCGDCTKFSHPCPSVYNSTDSYLYRECYTGCGVLKSSKEMYLLQQTLTHQVQNLTHQVQNLTQQQQNFLQQLKEKTKQIESLKKKNKSFQDGLIAMIVLFAIPTIALVAIH